MAKIKDIEIKAVTYVRDHDSFKVPNGNIYYKNKKVGEYTSDTMGGESLYRHTHKTISEEEVDKAVKEAYKVFEEDVSFMYFDIVVEHLLKLKEREREFKKVTKDDYFLVVAEEESENGIVTEMFYYVPIDTEEVELRNIKKVKKLNPRATIDIYKSLDDFNKY